MAHNSRLRTDSAWTLGTLVKSSEWLTIDTNLTKAWNGAGGGTWTPTGHYVIGGAGMWFAGAAHSFGGTNSTLTTSVSGNKRIVHGDNDHILLGSGHSAAARNIVTSWAEARYDARHWDYDVTNDRIVSLTTGARAVVRMHVHNGARIASVTFNFVVGSSHGPPAVLPQFRVYALDNKGVRTLLLPTGSVNYTQFTPQPANAAAWFASGAVQSFTYSIDSAIVIADTSKYTYWAEVIEEQGSGSSAGNKWTEVVVGVTLINDMRPG